MIAHGYGEIGMITLTYPSSGPMCAESAAASPLESTSLKVLFKKTRLSLLILAYFLVQL